MAKFAQLPDGSHVEFPDAWTETQMDEAVYRDFADQFPERAAEASAGPANIDPGSDAGLLANSVASLQNVMPGAVRGVTDPIIGGLGYATGAVGDFSSDLLNLLKDAAVPPAETYDAVSGAQPLVSDAETLASTAEKMGAVPTARETLAGLPSQFAGKAVGGLADLPKILSAIQTVVAGDDAQPNYVLPGGPRLGQMAEGIEGLGERIASSGAPRGMESLPPTDIRRGAYEGVGSAGYMAPSLLLGAVKGVPAALNMIMAQVAGDEYGPLVEAGYEPPLALFIAGAKGGVEKYSEMLPMHKLYEQWGSKWVKGALDYVLAETGTEITAEAANSVIDKLTTQKDLTWGDFQNRLKALAVQLPFAIGTQVAAGKGLQKVTDPIRQKAEIDAIMAEFDAPLKARAERVAVEALSPDQGAKPEVTTQRPEQVGPAASPFTAEGIAAQMRTNAEAREASRNLGGRASGAQALTVDEARDEQMRILDDRMRAANAQRATTETDAAYAQKAEQDQEARDIDLPEARVQAAKQEAELVADMEQQDKDFAARPSTMAQAMETALDKAIVKNFKEYYGAESQPEDAEGVVGQRDEMALDEDTVDGKVSLVHFSRKQGMLEIDPAMHGTGVPGLETKRKKSDPDSWVDRSYFYIGEPGSKDVMLGKNRYQVQVDASQLYDAKADPDGLQAQARDMGRLDLSKYEQAIKAAGYKGYWTDTPEQGKVAAVFDKMPISRVNTDRPGGASAEFFTKMTLGEDGLPDVEYKPLLKAALGKTEFIEEYDKHRGNFDNHIRASIPGFGEVQVMVGDAIVSAYGTGASVLDIGASEGSWAKTITANSQGRIKTTGLEPLKAMADFFESQSQVPGSQVLQEAWGDAGWTEPDGTEVRPFKPTKTYDVVHESMTFQFIDNNRADHIKRAKASLKPAGVLLTEEKFRDDGTQGYKAREAQKDQYKRQYFTKEAIKNKEKETLTVGMNDNMVTKAELEQTLLDNFDHVVEYWSAGNFAGYAASDDRVALERLVGKIGDTTSEYSAAEGPRWVSEKNVPAMLRKQAGAPEPVGPDLGQEVPAFLRPQALTVDGDTAVAGAPSAYPNHIKVHQGVEGTLSAIPSAGVVATNFDSELHVVTKEAEPLVRAFKGSPIHADLRLPTEPEHFALRHAMSDLTASGFPLAGASLGARLFLAGEHDVQGRHEVVFKQAGNRAVISVSSQVLELVASEGAPEAARASLIFTLTHELGHSIDVREKNDHGEVAVGFSELSPLFNLSFNPADHGPIIKEIHAAYLNDSLGLRKILHYPMGKMDTVTNVAKAKDSPVEWTTAAVRMQRETFAQLFAVYYTYGQDAQSLEALRAVMPESITFMEQIHDVLENQSPTLDERDRSIRDLFRGNTLDRTEVDGSRGDERGDTERPKVEQTGARVPAVPGGGRREGADSGPTGASTDVLTTNAAFNAHAGGPDYMQFDEDQQPQSPEFTVPDESWKDRAARALHDKFQRLYVTQEAIRGQGGSLDIDINAWAAEERFHGKVELDLRVLEEDHIEPLVKAMADQGVSVEDLDAYIMARHAPERNAVIAERRSDMPDGGSGMTNGEAADTRTDLESRFPMIEGLAQRVWAVLALKRQHMKDFSLMGVDTLDSWEASYKYYVPLKGFAEDAIGDDFPRIGAGFSIKGREAKAALGRTRKAFSPLVQTLQDATEAIIRGRKNEVGQVLLALVEANPNPQFWKIFDEKNPDLEPSLQKGRVKMSPSAMANNPKYFGVKREGKQFFIKLNDPLLAQAMQNLGVEKQGVYIRTMAAATRFLSSVNTAMDPEFVVSNFSRDIQTAVYNALAEQDLSDAKVDTKRLARKMISDAVNPALAMRSAHRALRRKAPRPGNAYDQYAIDFMADGAKTGFFNTRDVEAQKRYVDHLLTMARGGVVGKGLSVAKSVADTVADYNGTIENAVRLAAYKNAREIMERRGIPEGQARKRAAHLAKNLTVNFNRRGEISTVLNAHYMFFNASAQGSAQFARTMLTGKKGPDGKRHLSFPQKVAASAVAAAYLFALLNRAWSDDDDDGNTYYDNIPASEKERNIIIMKGDGQGHWSIPLPYGYNLFHVLGTTVSDVIHGPASALEGAGRLAAAVLGSFNPVGMSTDESLAVSAFKTITPTLLTPGAELLANSNFWGGKIYLEDKFNERTPASAQALNAKEHFKMLSSWLNEATGGSLYERGGIDVSPDAFEHLFDFATGGAGRFVNRSVGLAEKLATGQPVEQNQIPFWRKIGKDPAKYLASARYYEVRDTVLAKEDTLKGLRGAERTAFREGSVAFQPLIRGVHRADGALQALRARRDRELSKAKSPAEESTIRREYQDRANAEYNSVNRQWGDYLKQR